MRNGSPVIGALGLVLSLSGCSIEQDSKHSLPNHPIDNLTYEAWCQDWGLTCQEATPVPAIMQHSWDATMGIGSELFNGEGSLVLTRDQLLSGELEEFLLSSGFFDAMKPAWEIIKNVEWQELEISSEQNILLRGLNEGSTTTLASGLVLGSAATEAQLELGEGVVVVHGLDVGTATHEPESLHSMTMTDGTMSFTTDRSSVDGVPMSFWFENEVPDFSLIPIFKDMAQSLGKAAGWLLALNQNLTVEAAVFDAATEYLGPFQELLGDVDSSGLIGSIGQLKVGPVEPIIEAELDAGVGSVVCMSVDPNGRRTKLTYADSFGIESVNVVNDEKIEVTVFGVHAKIYLGIFNPSLDIREMELDSEGLTIHNVPIVGTHTLPWEDLQDENTGQLKSSLDCG